MMKLKLLAVSAVFILIVLSFSGCIFDDSQTDSRTLGYMMDHFKNLEFQDHEEGDSVTRIDTIHDAEYIEKRNITKVWMESFKKRPILFRGDLTSNYYVMPDDSLKYNVTVIEKNNIEYIREFWRASE